MSQKRKAEMGVEPTAWLPMNRERKAEGAGENESAHLENSDLGSLISFKLDSLSLKDFL